MKGQQYNHKRKRNRYDPLKDSESMQYSVIGTGVIVSHSYNSQYDNNSSQYNVENKHHKKEGALEMMRAISDHHCKEVEEDYYQASVETDFLKCEIAFTWVDLR